MKFERLPRRFPAHVPRDQRALPGIPFQRPQHGRCDGFVLRRQFFNGSFIPGRKVLSGPFECLVEMAEVAGVGTSGQQTGFDGGVVDLMRADAL